MIRPLPRWAAAWLLPLAVTVHAASPIEATIRQLQPGSEIQSIRATPLPGIFEVALKDFDPVYMSEDGRYFFSGQLLHLDDRGRVVNLTDEKQRQARATLLAQVPAADQIVFSPAQPRARVYVFTDVDCAYCRKFHTEIEAYNALGVEVHYLAYPRGGPGSGVFTTMQSVWCAQDRKAALTKAKAGGDIPKASCASPVARQYALGQAVGVKGTPAVFTEDGTPIGGFLTPEQLRKALGL